MQTRFLRIQKKERAHRLVTGRAKKRLLYNRRIKNAAALRGGPNFQGESFRKPTVDGAVLNMTFVPKKRLQLASRSSTDLARHEDTYGYSRYESFYYRYNRTHHRKMKGVHAPVVSQERKWKLASHVSALFEDV